jgi:hypothetical protein
MRFGQLLFLTTANFGHILLPLTQDCDTKPQSQTGWPSIFWVNPRFVAPPASGNAETARLGARTDAWPSENCENCAATAIPARYVQKSPPPRHYSSRFAVDAPKAPS